MSDCRSLRKVFAAWEWLKLAETSRLAVLDSDDFPTTQRGSSVA